MSQHIEDDTLKILAKTIIENLGYELEESTNKLVNWIIDSSHEGYASVSLDDVFQILTGNEEK